MGDPATPDPRQQTDGAVLDEGPDYAVGHPVEGFPMRFRWQAGVWEALFDKQIELLERDIARARADGACLVFQSSPLTGRGGGHFSTNVEIADHTSRKLMEEWGHRFWFLNPARYQMESKEGTGLMQIHARELSRETGREIDIDRMFAESPPRGGDYMRMWTKILVEDGEENLGRRWDGIYFLGPREVRDFFAEGGNRTWTAGIEEYFARKVSMDEEFHDTFTPPFYDEAGDRLTGEDENREWSRRRSAFFRYYTVRAGVNFSLGSHDEWNIWVAVNARRRAADPTGISDQIAGFFNGVQLDPASFASRTTPGYEVVD